MLEGVTSITVNKAQFSKKSSGVSLGPLPVSSWLAAESLIYKHNFIVAVQHKPALMSSHLGPQYAASSSSRDFLEGFQTESHKFVSTDNDLQVPNAHNISWRTISLIPVQQRRIQEHSYIYCDPCVFWD